MDLSGAPKDVQEAMAGYFAAVEANLEVRRILSPLSLSIEATFDSVPEP